MLKGNNMQAQSTSNNRSNTTHFIAVTVLTVIVSVLLFGLFNYVLFPRPLIASQEAATIETMFNVHMGLIAFLFGLIMVFMLYSTIVFRRKEGDTEDAVHVHGNLTLEIIWIVVPTITVILFGAWAVNMFWDLTDPNEGEMIIQVEGRQWAWNFRYPGQADDGGDVVSPDLWLPVDQPILLEMTSEDVIHAFWVPEFRVKQDLVPGHTTVLRLTPTELTDPDSPFRLLCAEICGNGHAVMRADVHVMETADFDAKMSELSIRISDLPPAERGEFWRDQLGCAGCHSPDGTPLAGPTWAGLYGADREFTDGTTAVADDAYITNSIQNPNAQIVNGFAEGIMPQGYTEQITELEAEYEAREGVEFDIYQDIIEYIKTLEE